MLTRRTIAAALIFFWNSQPVFALDIHHHRHHAAAVGAAPGAQMTGFYTGQMLGYQLNQRGNYDTASRNEINNTTATALDKSAAIDGMLASDAIAPDGWLMLKAAMANSMESAAGQEMTNPDLPSAANGGLANGSGNTGFQDQAGLLSSAAAADDARALAGASNQAAAGAPLLNGSKNGNSNYGDSTPGMPVGAFAVPVASATTGTVPNFNGFNQTDKGKAAETQKSAPPTTASSSSSTGTSPALTGNQRALLLAQALLGKGRVAGALSKQLPKKSKGFPDPIKELFGKSRAKYASTDKAGSATRDLASESVGENTGGSPATLAAPDYDEDDGLNWTLIFLILVGVFACAIGIYIGYHRRPSKSRMQLMVPANGQHFTIRPAEAPGEYILDIKDIRGNLVRSAGMLRPQSVARAAVLPPALAAELGAQGSFDRFELTPDGHFKPTEKEEGYQIFPFVLT